MAELFDVGAAGVTSVTDTGEVVVAAVGTVCPDDDPPVVLIFTFAVLSPGSRVVRSAVSVSVIPPGGRVPLDGVIVSQGRSLVAVNCTAEPCPGTNSVRVKLPLPNGTMA